MASGTQLTLAAAPAATVGLKVALSGALRLSRTASMRQRYSPEAPDWVPGCKASRAGSEAIRRRSTERMLLTVLPTTAPMAPSTTASRAIATKTSIKVKPAVPRGGRMSERAMRHHIDASGQPVDANLVADAETRQRDDAAARHSRRKEIDRHAGRAIVTTRRQHGVDPHVGRQLHDAAARAGADGAGFGVDDGLDAHALAQRRHPVGFEHGRGGDRIAFEPGTAGRPRNGGKDDGGE